MMGVQDYHVSDIYNGSLDSLTEVHRQGILQHSYNIFCSLEQQSDNINGLYLEVQNLLTLIQKCIYKTKLSFIESVFIVD